MASSVLATTLADSQPDKTRARTLASRRLICIRNRPFGGKSQSEIRGPARPTRARPEPWSRSLEPLAAAGRPPAPAPQAKTEGEKRLHFAQRTRKLKNILQLSVIVSAATRHQSTSRPTDLVRSFRVASRDPSMAQGHCAAQLTQLRTPTISWHDFCASPVGKSVSRFNSIAARLCCRWPSHAVVSIPWRLWRANGQQNATGSPSPNQSRMITARGRNRCTRRRPTVHADAPTSINDPHTHTQPDPPSLDNGTTGDQIEFCAYFVRCLRIIIAPQTANRPPVHQ